MRKVMFSPGLVFRTGINKWQAMSLLALWLVLAGVPARAQQQNARDVIQSVDEDDDDDRPWVEGVPLEHRRQAYALFLEGNTIIKDGLFPRAVEKYKAALDLWEHPAFHYNLGIAQMNLDQIVDAYQRFQAARQHGPRPIGEDKYKQAQVYLNLLGNQLAEIEVICEEPDAEVVLDGKILFRGPGRQHVLVRPGGHRAEAVKPGRLPDGRQLVLDPGSRKIVTLAPQLPLHLSTTRRWPQSLPWAVAGAGVMALGGAGIMDQRSSTLFDRFDRGFDQLCPGAFGCMDQQISGELRAPLDHARTWQWAARATYVAGGLTVATSAALLYLNRERIVHERRPDGSGRVSLNPMLMPHGAAVSAQLRF
jgi:hypothetical protein